MGVSIEGGTVGHDLRRDVMECGGRRKRRARERARVYTARMGSDARLTHTQATNRATLDRVHVELNESQYATFTW